MQTDLTKIQQKYKGLWVALDSKWKTVLGSDKDIKIARDKAIEKGAKSPIMFKVPEKDMAYFGSLMNG